MKATDINLEIGSIVTFTDSKNIEIIGEVVNIDDLGNGDIILDIEDEHKNLYTEHINYVHDIFGNY